jgi:hypothetical protein
MIVDIVILYLSVEVVNPSGVRHSSELYVLFTEFRTNSPVGVSEGDTFVYLEGGEANSHWNQSCPKRLGKVKVVGISVVSE